MIFHYIAKFTKNEIISLNASSCFLLGFHVVF
ncbi:hypothetical protein EZS27_024666 [termite gut metagenome]|uniref:Uncharacterized protein n=1 Tax=termite gut metagenome TaxID=433724 RepID=A0A5J4QWG0_9ZZZZ